MDPLTLSQHEGHIRSFESTLKDDDKSAYETEKRTRTVLRAKVTRAINNLQTEIDEDERDVDKLKSYLEYLIETAGKLETSQQELEELITSDEALDGENYIHFHRYAKRVMDLKATTSKIVAVAKVTESSSVTLPKAQLPKFDGSSCSAYKTFHALFTSMVDRKNITKAEKLTYLKLCLTDQAKVLADGYTEISESNYDGLLAQLESRYGLQRLITKDHIYDLLEMPTFASSNLSTWLNKFVSHLKSLEATGMNLEANSSFIVCIAQKRMPNYLLARWQEEVAEELTF